jgi:glucosamine 6-phosphate synthetase-like amidotransferase/phosphosugar isomerase protein
MCGIFGYAHYNVTRSVYDVLDCLFKGLQMLEYRGYDSAGTVSVSALATLGSNLLVPLSSLFGL